MPTEVQTLQGRLDAPADDGRRASRHPATGPVGLFRHLEASGRFHRDTGLGRIFHPGRLSLREHRRSDSLHVVIHHDHIAAHVDRVSPLGPPGGRAVRYSLRRATIHNVAGMAQDLVRLVRGRQGDHRSRLDCEWIWDHSESGPHPSDLLDPGASAWSVQIEARVSGTLDEGRLRRALAATVGGDGAGGPLAVDCPDDTALGAARDELQRSPVGATGRPPLRASLARHPDGDVLMINLNHAASDGVAALGVLRAIATAYAGDGDGDAAEVNFLSTSDVPVRPASAPVSALSARWRQLVERVRDLMANPARLAPDQAVDGGGYGFHLRSLSVDDTRPVVDVQRAGTSRNVLVAGLHLAIGEWNLAHGTPGRRVGVLVPVDLRPTHWQETKVANFSVTARISTSRRHRADGPSALKAVAAQTTRNKRTRTGIALIAALERSGLVDLWARQSLVVLQPLTRNRYLDTALLANLGSLEQPPSFGPDAGETVDLWFSVPARSPLTLCVGAVTVGDRLHLAFRYPHRLFSPDAARRFADLYLDQIRQVAASRR